MVMKKILIALALLLTGIASGSACTGISFLAEDGGYVQARTIEWGDSYLPSEYVIVPRGQDLVSYTPTGVNGLRFRAKYGLVGLAIIQKEFVAEGLNEVGLSAGLFYFPHYGKYEEYDEAQNAITLSASCAASSVIPRQAAQILSCFHPVCERNFCASGSYR